MTLITHETEEGRNHVIVNGKGGEIPYIKSFDTETKEVTMYLYDAENFAINGADGKPIEIKVIIPEAKLVKLLKDGKAEVVPETTKE